MWASPFGRTIADPCWRKTRCLAIEIPDRLRNTLDERRLHIRPERQRHNFGAGLLGMGELAFSRHTRGECRLDVQRNGIVNSRSDLPIEQMLAELVSSLG